MQKRSEKMILVSSFFIFRVLVKQTGLDSILLPNHKNRTIYRGALLQGFVWSQEEVGFYHRSAAGRISRVRTLLMNRILHFPPIVSNKIAGVARFKNRYG